MMGNIAKLNNYKLKWIAILLFLLYPIASVPLIVAGILKKQKWAFILFSCFMGLLAILYPPAGDLYRYAEDFELYSTSDWNTFCLLLIFKFDYFLPLLSYVIGHLGGTAELTRFIFAFLSYYLMFDLFSLICRDNNLNDKKIYIYAFIIFIPLTFWTFLFRYYFALAFLLNGSYRWFVHNEKKGILLVALSVLAHVSYLPFFFLCFVSKNRFFKFSYFVVLLLCILALCCDTTSIGEKILSYLPFSDSLLAHIGEYIDGSQSESSVNNFSLKQMVIYMFSNVLSFYVLYVYLKIYKKKFISYMGFINSTLLMLLFSSSFPVIFSRLMSVCLFQLKMSILAFSEKYQQVHFKILCYISIFVLLVSVWQRRFFFTDGYLWKIFTSTSLEIVTFSYPDSWVNNHLDEDGDFYNRLNAVD